MLYDRKAKPVHPVLSQKEEGQEKGRQSAHLCKEVYTLSLTDIITGLDGKKWISKDRQKTNGDETLPILPIALRILEKYKDHYVMDSLQYPISGSLCGAEFGFALSNSISNIARLRSQIALFPVN